MMLTRLISKQRERGDRYPAPCSARAAETYCWVDRCLKSVYASLHFFCISAYRPHQLAGENSCADVEDFFCFQQLLPKSEVPICI